MDDTPLILRYKVTADLKDGGIYDDVNCLLHGVYRKLDDIQ